MIEDKVLNSFLNKKVLVTGGTGLIGRQVVDILCDSGVDVVSVSLDNLELNKKVKYIQADLRNFEICEMLTKDVDYVFHIAGIKGSIKVTEEKPASHFVPALMFNTNVLEACRINKVKKIVYTSSIGAYAAKNGVIKESDIDIGQPMDFYAGWAKRMGEYQIKTYNIQYGLDNFAIVRPCNVYGPGDNFNPDNAMVIPSLMYRIYHKEFPLMIWGDGSAIRDFAYSRDVAEGIILALYYGTYSRFVNLGSGNKYTIKELVETLNKFIDFEYAFDTSKPIGFSERVLDITVARKIIDYNPTTTLLDGLKQTWDWYINNQREYFNKKNYFVDE